MAYLNKTEQCVLEGKIHVVATRARVLKVNREAVIPECEFVFNFYLLFQFL